MSSADEKIGILDPEGINPNPLTGQPFSQSYRNMTFWTKLPVYRDADKIIRLIEDNQVLLITSGTGSGKTVIIPKLALHATRYQGRVIITMPKRGITQTTAVRNAKALNVELGREVGYQYRNAKLSDGRPSKSEATRLLFSTDGSVVAQLIKDPELRDVDIIIVDEAHERSIQIDLLLLLIKKALKLNPKLKLIIMSATINTEIFNDYFKKDFRYSYIHVSGETNFPIEVKYLSQSLKNPEKDFVEAGISIIVKLLTENVEGDIIMFITSVSEARRACGLLHQKTREANIKKVFCVEASSGSWTELKDYIEDPVLYRSHPNGPFEKKIIMATNAVESSLTVQGLVYIIDSGWAIVESYSAEEMKRQLLMERISQAQADQRKGRVGRTQPGVCYRLYTKEDFGKFIKYPVTDIAKSDLTEDLLRLLQLSYVGNIGSLLALLGELIEPPPKAFVKSGLYRLFALGAITEMTEKGVLTDIGRQIGKFRKLDTSLARMVIEGFYRGVAYETILLSAILVECDGRIDSFFNDARRRGGMSEREFKDEQKRLDSVRRKYSGEKGDIFSLYKIYMDYRNYADEHGEGETRTWGKKNFLRTDTLGRIRRTMTQISDEAYGILGRNQKTNQPQPQPQNGGEPVASANTETNVLMSFAKGFYSNLATITGEGKGSYQNCFPFIKERAKLSRDTLLKFSDKTPKHIIYWEYANILGNTKFSINTAIPDSIIKSLSEKEIRLIADCLKPQQKQTQPGQKQGQKQGQQKQGEKQKREPKRKYSARRSKKQRR